jgi:RNA polymerase sigma factor (sigma-70 family)
LSSPNPNDRAKGVERATHIFAEHGDFIHSVIRSRAKDRAQADDLLQEFFITLALNPPPEGLQNIKGYLYRTITNDIIDAARWAQKYQARMQRYAERLKYSTIEDNPESALIRAEQMANVFKIIESRLQRSEAEAFILRYRNHRKIKDIADKIGVNDKAARKCISEALRKLRYFMRIG